MTSPTYLLALDQGTSSSRALVFRDDGQVHSMAQQEFAQIYPQPGWVEHDPMAIWQSQLDTARQALAQGGLSTGDVRAVGITNQRETTVLWDRRTGQPLHNAIVWQDRRTEGLCRQLREAGHESRVQALTGLRLQPVLAPAEAIIAFAKLYDPQPFHLSEEGGRAGPFGVLSAYFGANNPTGSLPSTAT